MRSTVLLALLLALAGCDNEISEDSFEGKWPFTVSSGILKCENRLVIFSAGGVDYGINGSAKNAGYPEPHPIWKESDDSSVWPSVPMGDILRAGLKLCKN